MQNIDVDMFESAPSCGLNIYGSINNNYNDLL